MHRMAELGMRNSHALLGHLTHSLVGRHRPFYFDWLLRHATASLQRFWRDLGPNHKPVRRRFTRSNTQPKRISREYRVSPDGLGEKPARGCDKGGGAEHA